MATQKELIEKLKQDKVIQAIPKLQKLVKQLEVKHKQSEKISGQDCTLIGLMADGMEYDEAYRESRKN